MSTAVTKLLRGSASNVVRLACVTLVGLAVPPVLTRYLSADEYSAWVLILQLGTYIGLLDLGLQSVVSRFVAEHDATDDRAAGARVLTTAVVILTCSAALGVVAIVVSSFQVPAIFSGMPHRLDGQVQAGLLIVAVSWAFTLPFGPFLSAFTGLQSYVFPTVLTIVSRLLFAALMISAVALGGGIVQLAIASAVVNVLTAMAQYAGWRWMVSERFATLRAAPGWASIRLMLSSGGVIALWTVGGLFVSGLDTVIVGRFDFGATGAYALATSAVNFLLLLVNSLFSPLLPSTAAIQGADAETRVGRICLLASRYCTTLICVLGAVLVLFAYPLLQLWVGERYAVVSAPLLQLLVIGNCIRQLGYPYSLIVIARGKQVYATLATVSEAVVNFGSSIVLAQVLGAAGVAIGTILGAAVSVLLHLLVSMRWTRTAIPMNRWTFATRSLLRPALCAAPLLLMIPLYSPGSTLPVALPWLLLWAVLTLCALAFAGLTATDRAQARRVMSGLASRAVHA